jgi:hypothetical protein
MKKTEVIGIRITKEHYDKIKELAKKEERSIGNYIMYHSNIVGDTEKEINLNTD